MALGQEDWGSGPKGPEIIAQGLPWETVLLRPGLKGTGTLHRHLASSRTIYWGPFRAESLGNLTQAEVWYLFSPMSAGPKGRWAKLPWPVGRKTPYYAHLRPQNVQTPERPKVSHSSIFVKPSVNSVDSVRAFSSSRILARPHLTPSSAVFQEGEKLARSPRSSRRKQKIGK
jgi:hypothetical protein